MEGEVNQDLLDDETLCFMGVEELKRNFRSGRLSPVAVLQAQVRRIERENARFNCVTQKHYEEALLAARESERRYREGIERELEGITVAIKDEARAKGWRTTYGSLLCREAPLEEADDPLVARMRSLGVVMHIQTNVPEFSCNAVCWNKLWGVCRNPWNVDFTPGGSSGGSAASVALGFSTLATGSDMGGSIRIPAAMCGVYGFKPPYGRNASHLYSTLVSQGPIARTFNDLVIFQNAWAGPSEFAMTAIKPKLEYPMSYQNISGWKIAYDPLKRWGAPIDSSVTEAMEKTIETLRGLGATVEEVDLEFTIDDLDIYLLGLFSTSMGPIYLSLAAHPLAAGIPDLYTSYIYKLVDLIKGQISPDHLLRMEAWMTAKHQLVQRKVFGAGFHAIIMPTLITPNIPADLGIDDGKNSVTVNGNPFHIRPDLRGWIYFATWQWNILGSYPVVNVPIGRAPNNVPIGMQIIADTFEDLNALQVAANLPNPFLGEKPI